MIVNLFDNAFRHLPISVHGKSSRCIEYVRDRVEWDGVTLFTDSYVSTPAASMVKCPVKIGWILECRSLIPAVYNSIGKFIDQYDFVLTHDPELLEKYPTKTRKSIFGGCWVEEDAYSVYPKTKNLSMVYSDKTFMSGHKLRHDIVNLGIDGLDLFGRGSRNPIKRKEQALTEYRYSLAIENCSQNNYFTEKILDCFSTGTIPVYYGCPNIKDYFDSEGIITFSSKEEFLSLLPTLTEDTYIQKMESVNNNFLKFKDYAVTEDWLYYNVLNEYENDKIS